MEQSYGSRSFLSALRHTSIFRPGSSMSTLAANPSDQALYNMVSGATPGTIADVIAIMKSIDALLPESDGLKWFNREYLMVTEDVNAKPPGGVWQSPAWLDRLDVVFAGFYFQALADS